MKHPLDTFFEATGLTPTEFCRRANISAMTLSRLRRGEGECSTGLIRRVAAATQGAVSEIQIIAAFEAIKRTKTAGAA